MKTRSRGKTSTAGVAANSLPGTSWTKLAISFSAFVVVALTGPMKLNTFHNIPHYREKRFLIMTLSTRRKRRKKSIINTLARNVLAYSSEKRDWKTLKRSLLCLSRGSSKWIKSSQLDNHLDSLPLTPHNGLRPVSIPGICFLKQIPI